MPHSKVFEAVFQLEKRLGAEWGSIRKAHGDSLDFHSSLDREINGRIGEDASVVVLGSGGRYEVTAGSDADWTYLIDGQAKVHHQTTALQIKEIVEGISKKPGQEGVFGVMAFSHDLIQYVGGQWDTNANLTRRILLLLESKAIGRPDAYTRVIRATLEQYLNNDFGWQHGSTKGLCRFLLNDVIRYWHTVCVDFAYKRKSRGSEGWALRSAKLRLSRKLTFAAGLLYCFSISAELWSEAPDVKDSQKRPKTIEHLDELTKLTPLDLLATAFARSSGLDTAAKLTFDSYNRFLAILDSETDRGHLKALKQEDGDDDKLYQEIRNLGFEFQRGLTALFIDNNDTPLPALVREFGVF